MNLCPRNFGSNVLVNQNCLNVTDPDLQGRGQAQNETAIAQNPFNPRQLVAGFNDYRRGDGTCGTAFSGNGGSSWTDSTMPNGFTRGTAFGNVARQYWQAGGDPSVAWDTRGNAYYACQVFMRGPGDHQQPRPVQRCLRVPLHRRRRRVLELHRPPRDRDLRHDRHGS